MIVRPATADDLPELDRIAEQDRSEALAELGPPARPARRVDRARLRRRLLAASVLVGLDPSGHIEAFATVGEADDAVTLTAFLAPSHPSRELSASGFVLAVRERGWRGPVTSEAILGDLAHEAFLERAGFVPGEVLDEGSGTTGVLRRRWWLPAQVERPPPAR